MASTNTMLLALAFCVLPRLAHADDNSLLRPTDILVAVENKSHEPQPISSSVTNERIDDLETGAALWHLAGGVTTGLGVATMALGVGSAVYSETARCKNDDGCEGLFGVGVFLTLIVGLPVSIGGYAMYRRGSRLQDEANHLRTPRVTPAIGRNTVGITLRW